MARPNVYTIIKVNTEYGRKGYIRIVDDKLVADTSVSSGMTEYGVVEIDLMSALTDMMNYITADQRSTIISNYCKCGDKLPCHCQNDE